MYATALDNAGESDKALAVIEELHRLPPPDGDDPEVDVLEAVAADHVSDQKHAQSAARAAIASAHARGQRLTEADGHLELAESLWGVYDYDSSLPEFQLARATYEDLGEKRKLSAALAGISGLQTDQGEPQQALPTITQAVEVARAIGDHFQIGVRLRQLGDTRASLGDVKLARQAWEDMRNEFATLGVERESARAVGRLGRAFAMEGDATRARASLVEARERERAVHSLDHALEETLSLAALALDAGDLAEAEHQASDALASAREADDRLSAAQAQLYLAWIARERGDGAASAKTLGEATEGFTATHDGDGRIDTKLLLATLALDGGRGVDAEADAREAVDAAHAGGYRPREADARALLARALLAQGRTAEASTEMDRAEALPLEDVATPIDVALARAAVLAAQGATTRAQEVLDGALARAQSAALLPRALEAKEARARLRPSWHRR